MTNTIFHNFTFRSLNIIDKYCADKLTNYEQKDLQIEIQKRIKFYALEREKELKLKNMQELF